MKWKLSIVIIIAISVSVVPSNALALEEITFLGLDGKNKNFSDFLGKKYLFVDTFATWCGPCKKAAPHIQEMIDYRGEVIDVISISISPETDSLDAVQNFVNSAGYSWNVGIDITGEFQNNYPSANLPTYFIFSPDGTLIYQFTIDEASSGIDYIKIVDTYVPNSLTDLPNIDTDNTKLIQLLGLSLFIGFLTSLSPCLFPMMPTYFSIVAKDNKTSKSKLFLSVLLLGLGVMIVFTTLGLIYNVTIGSFLISNYSTFLFIQGAILLLAGILLVKTPKFILNITLPNRLNELLYSDKVQSNTFLLSFLVGLFYTIIAAPCAFSYFLWEWSLVLAEPYGIKLMAFALFSFGTILPFMLIAIFLPEIKAQFTRTIQQGSNVAKYIIGLVLIIIGFYLILNSKGIVSFF